TAAAARAATGSATDPADADDAAALRAAAAALADRARPVAERIALADDDELAARVARHPDRALASATSRPYPLLVEPAIAACAAWYELFPRSLGAGGRHGTLADVEAALPYVAGMGFDV